MENDLKKKKIRKHKFTVGSLEIIEGYKEGNKNNSISCYQVYHFVIFLVHVFGCLFKNY